MNPTLPDYVLGAMKKLDQIRSEEDFELSEDDPDDPDFGGAGASVFDMSMNEALDILERAFDKFHATEPDKTIEVEFVIQKIKSTRWSKISPSQALEVIEELGSLLFDLLGSKKSFPNLN